MNEVTLPSFDRKKYYIYIPGICTEAEFLDEIQTKVSRVFRLAIHSHLYNVAFKLTQPLKYW